MTQITEQNKLLILNTVKRQYKMLNTDSQKILINLMGKSKEDINNFNSSSYLDEFLLLYETELDNIDTDNINPSGYFIQVNEMLSGKRKSELNKLITNYE